MRFIFFTITTLCLIGIFGFNQKKADKKVIVLDPRYAFFKGDDSVDLAFEILENVRTSLQQKGYLVLMTTEKYKATSLKERMQFANGHNADLYVTLSCQNVNPLKGRGKKKDITENYMIYPVAGKNLIIGKDRDTGFISVAKEFAAKLQSQLAEKRLTPPRVFNSVFVYDVPCYGIHLSLYYKPHTPLYQTLTNKEYQATVADALITAIEQQISANAGTNNGFASAEAHRMQK